MSVALGEFGLLSPPTIHQKHGNPRVLGCIALLRPNILRLDLHETFVRNPLEALPSADIERGRRGVAAPYLAFPRHSENLMKKTLPAALLAFALATVVALPASGADPAPTGPVGVGNGAFHAQCAYSHSLKDDPIVFPNGPGASHLHDFFGSVSTDAMSTNQSIQTSSTSCIRYASANKFADKSAYWVPSVLVGGTVVDPIETGVYYKTGIRHMQSIKPYPAGFRMIAGTSSGAPSIHFSGERIWAYLCPGGVLTAQTSTSAPTCKTSEINISIRFPDCWDGFSLDSSDHKSHAAYSRKVARRDRPDLSAHAPRRDAVAGDDRPLPHGRWPRPEAVLRCHQHRTRRLHERLGSSQAGGPRQGLPERRQVLRWLRRTGPRTLSEPAERHTGRSISLGDRHHAMLSATKDQTGGASVHGGALAAVARLSAADKAAHTRLGVQGMSMSVMPLAW